VKRSQFIGTVFRAVGIPETTENIEIGVAWAQAEGSRALNNPLDTEQGEPGATDFNSAGVKNFPSWTEGIDATVTTLTNGDYEAVIEAFKNPAASLMDKLNAVNSSPWGTTISLADYAEVKANFAVYDTEVAGSPEGKPSEVQVIDANEPKTERLPILRIGSKGRPVAVLTSVLNHLHCSTDPNDKSKIVPVTDEFDEGVENAVKEYQTEEGIQVDGIVGPQTWSSFFF
jgi:murein L,D-transpeptidase YcbB/YkuD